MLHHYTEFIDASTVAEADVAVAEVIQAYQEIERGGTDFQFRKSSQQATPSTDLRLFPEF